METTQLRARSLKWLYASVGFYLVIVLAGFFTRQYWALGIPLLIATLVAAFCALDMLLLAVALITPLSINLSDIGLGYGLSIPTEPMLAGIMLMFFIKI